MQPGKQEVVTSASSYLVTKHRKPTAEARQMVNWPSIAFLLGMLLCQSAIAEWKPLFPPDSAGTTPTSRGQIIVGVRPDARPFSYRTGSRHDERLLPDYGGYMIEICRRVLSEMTTSNGPFRDFSVVTRKVDVASRFAALEDGDIDMLCGPDSITPNRLGSYNVSHPVFLSGLTWATVKNEEFPQYAYCKPIVGLLARTTAETIGLQVLADNNELFRFDEALELYLSMVTGGGNASEAVSLLSDLRNFTSKLLDVQRHTIGSDRQWLDPGISRAIKTRECPDGFEGGPVVRFTSHHDGLTALCKKEIFYYLGDRDILKSKVAGMPTCQLDVKPNTITSEAYGVYFRQTSRNLRDEMKSRQHFPDSALQAEFNNALLRLMQESASILDYEFKREFAPSEPTDDLQRFFDSFKFASHHIREE